ncbi:MAG: YgjV family protein [Actinobacteria bacterium]|nr:YgjV family protein [Actinomycetota bacterium]MCG2800427.1 YgjV family protein [Cellulomonas sp.]
MSWLEVVGWAGSLLVVVSLTQARVLRFRVLNLVGALLATFYNAWVGIWAFASMNAAITVIDVYWLVRLLRERHDDRAYEVVEVSPQDAYLRHLLTVHRSDIARYAPELDPADPVGAQGGTVLLVVRGDETVGVVAVAGEPGGDGQVRLDWVTPRFRDFTPGEFVYRDSGVFAAHGYRRLVFPAPHAEQHAYLERVGFRRAGAEWVRSVEPV